MKGKAGQICPVLKSARKPWFRALFMRWAARAYSGLLTYSSTFLAIRPSNLAEIRIRSYVSDNARGREKQTLKDTTANIIPMYIK
ncbi:MAG TPA: hypothetical protein PL044_00045 [Clostridiales bacterium]|nr:hypothetical protein [Clostridiales bacterium]HQK72157.1 hypothetical protein [Clostridiales bacterium]